MGTDKCFISIVIKDIIIFKKQTAVWEMGLAGFNSVDKTNYNFIFKNAIFSFKVFFL